MIVFKALPLLNLSEVELKSHVDCTTDCRQFPVFSAWCMYFLRILTGLVGPVYYLHLVAWLTGVVIWKKLSYALPCWRSESFEMFYLRELLNSYSSLEIYVRRPSLYPVRFPFLLKRGKKEALCPISLKDLRGWAQIGRYPAVFCKLGRKDGLGTYTLHHHCKRTWTWWIPDRCCAGLFALFLHDLWQSNIMNVKNEW